jgi:tetratricopeptide (TPR) repeat protein
VIIEGPAGAGKSSLLSRFVQRLPDVMVVRGSGAEPELSLPYGLIGQLVAAADMGSRDTPPPTADPLVVGADLAGLLTRQDATGRLVVLAIDDLHWADPGSTAALLFALRRMQGAVFLGVLSTRAAEISLLGDGWSRFVNGDHRVTKLRVGALTVEEVQSLACAIGAGELSPGAASRLVRHTGGNLGYCRAVLEECSPKSWKDSGDPLPMPRQLAGPVLARLSALTMPAQALAAAAAVIGRSGLLATAAALAGLPDPVLALDELAGAGLAEEQAPGSGSRIVFCDARTHQVTYAGIGPIRRRQLHLQAAALGGNDAALRHRIAAAVGRDAALAADLEAAGREAAGLGAATAPRAAASAAGTGPAGTGPAGTGPAGTGPAGAGPAGTGPAGAEAAGRERMTRAAAWLAHASAMSPDPADSGRLILDAVEILLSCGEVAEAEALAPQVAETALGPRRSVLLGQLDLLAARPASAEALLSDAWQAHDPARAPLVGAQAATGLLACCLISGRLREAVAWGERAVGRAGADALHGTHAASALALALAHSQRGQEALATLDSVPACAGEVPLSQTDALVARGMVRVIQEDLEAASADLSAAAGRLRSGVPVRHACLCLGYLAEAEYRLGFWDDASRNAELAVMLARQAGRVADLSFAHGFAALVPAGRGDWATAAAHVDAAGAAARTAGSGLGITAWAAARAALAAARGDHEEVLRAVAAVRRTGRARAFGGLGVYDWRPFEVDALIALGSLDDAGRALAEIDASRSASSPASARIAAARLRGMLAAVRGDAARSAQAFKHAWEHARGSPLPF